MARASNGPSHITDTASDAIVDATEQVAGKGHEVPGPSPNPATNLIIHDILLRSVGRISRLTLEKALVGRKYGRSFASDAVENRSLMHTLAAYGVTKVATRSVPGALLVGAGLTAKTLYDRAQSKKTARRKGEKTLRKQADRAHKD